MLIPIFSIFGLILGAVLQFYFTQYLDNKKHQRDLKVKAYIDYLQCVSEQANLGYSIDTIEGRQIFARTADSKCRISLYGSPSVISAFSSFEKLGANFRTLEARESFTKLVSEMRKDTGDKSDPNKIELETLLLGLRDKKQNSPIK
ncbi:hypothetical protein KKF34_11355 [Myxococcota bacterium]|nr:hypothetical protein [Myxococcota bacterium]MBU1380447.1 hypothetical protein [Myxococcota bacterium]MBU1497460.1 hypothetical protein [Myxococcota bacterium]